MPGISFFQDILQNPCLNFAPCFADIIGVFVFFVHREAPIARLAVVNFLLRVNRFLSGFALHLEIFVCLSKLEILRSVKFFGLLQSFDLVVKPSEPLGTLLNIHTLLVIHFL